MSQATPASIPQAYSVQEAAGQIVALINSSPRSPRQDEIEAIIAKASTAAVCEKTMQWRAMRARHNAIWAARTREYNRLKSLGENATEAHLDQFGSPDAILDEQTAFALDSWRAGAKTWADVVLFAELALNWSFDPESPIDAAAYKALLVPHDTGLDDQSLAQLVNAVLTVAGKAVQS
jgi:hypothetical protein